MANDKLIYGSLAKINRRLKLPVRATIIGSILVAALACLLDIQDLADMVSIGTLTAYSLVSLSVMILRYEDRSDAVDDSTILNNHLTFTDILSSHSTGGFNNTSQQNQQAHKTTTPIETSHPKLTPKPSIPIREKGSRAVVAQFSVGFHSWFKPATDDQGQSSEMNSASESVYSTAHHNPKPSPSYLDLLVSWNSRDQEAQNRVPNDHTSHQSKVLISFIVTISILLDLVAFVWMKLVSPDSDRYQASDQLFIDPELLLYSSGCILLVLLATVMLMLSRLPNSRSMQPSEMFQVPWVPLIPTLSIFVNTFLMLNLSYLTWVRFTVWMAFGLFIYFTYGIWNSEGYLLYLGR